MKFRLRLVLVARGRAAAAGGDWKTAAAELTHACQSPAVDSYYWLGAATAAARAGDVEAFRRHGLAMIERFGSTDNWNEIERTVKNCVLIPGGAPVPSEMLAFVSKGIDDGTAPRGLVPWANTARGLVACRQADWDNAVKWADSAAIDQSANNAARALAYLVAALASHGQGNIAAAKERVAQAMAARDRQPLPRLADGTIDERLLLMEYNGWYDRINVELLRREVAALLESPAGSSALPAKTK